MRQASGILVTGYAAMVGLVLLIPRPATADTFSFSTGNPDGLLGALSSPASSGHLETETADDFVLTETTVINRATFIGLIPAGTPVANISEVEVEIYHIFPQDSVTPPSGNVPSRMNSPSDVEIDGATRSGVAGTLQFSASVLSGNFVVSNSVVDGIHKVPNNITHGEGSVTGEELGLTVTFTNPIILPAGHYFFRPQVLVTNGDFLWASAPRPIVPPGTPFMGDLQAWIRNSDLDPDWLRIGTDIIGGTATFNMTFALSGETVPNAGTPGQANCHGKSLSALALQFGGTSAAASSLGFSSVAALQGGFSQFCNP